MRPVLSIAFATTLLSVLVGCYDESRNGINAPTDLMLVAYGERFGECSGYCEFEINFVSSEPLYRATSADDIIEIDAELTPNDGAARWADADVPADASLEALYGCPDCDDGGAAWVVLRAPDGVETTHTFEASNPPDVLADAAALGVEVLTALQSCETTDLVRIISSSCTPVFDD